MQNEQLYALIVHAERRKQEALTQHDLDDTITASAYLQAIQDTALALNFSQPELKMLFRNARSVVEGDVRFSPENRE